MKHGLKPRELTLLGLLTAVLLVLSYTPLGYLNIGPLALTLNMIPVAIASIALGPVGGAFTGAVFGITSVLQCVGIGGTSLMGQITFSISPVLTIIQRLVARILVGLCTGYIYKLLKKPLGHTAASFITGFSAAFLNTVFFMGALVLLFGNTDYVRDLIGGQNVILWVCTYVGVQALFEMGLSTVITGILAKALEKAKLIGGHT